MKQSRLVIDSYYSPNPKVAATLEHSIYDPMNLLLTLYTKALEVVGGSDTDCILRVKNFTSIIKIDQWKVINYLFIQSILALLPNMNSFDSLDLKYFCRIANNNPIRKIKGN